MAGLGPQGAVSLLTETQVVAKRLRETQRLRCGVAKGSWKSGWGWQGEELWKVFWARGVT